jgi:hypothetical protein
MDRHITVELDENQQQLINRAAAGLNITAEQYLQRVADRHIESVKTRFGSSDQPNKTKH